MITLTYDELLDRPMVEADITLSCVSNEVGGTLVGNARWLGCRLDDLLDEAGIDPSADQIVGRSVDGFTAGFPTALLDGRDALVAVGMNGEPLPIRHGFPARLVVPGVYGYVSATKWLSEIELTRFDEFEGYWIPRGWAVEGPIKTQSRIDTPTRSATVTAGASTPIAGVAWAPTRGIERVEVQIDDGEWQAAELGEEYTDTTWRQWKLAWEPTPGQHQIRVRATDGEGETQTEERTPVAPDGATGWHTIRVASTGGLTASVSRPVVAAAGDLVAGHRTGGGHVERGQPAVQRDRGDQVAALAHQARQPLALGAQHQADAVARDGQLVHRGVARGVQADHPDAGCLHRLDRRRQSADERHRQVLHRARRGLGDRRGHVHGPVLGQHHPGDPGALGDAQQRAQVAGIGHAVDGQQERRSALARAAQLLERGLRQLGGPGHHALGRVGVAERRRAWPGSPR